MREACISRKGESGQFSEEQCNAERNDVPIELSMKKTLTKII